MSPARGRRRRERTARARLWGASEALLEKIEVAAYANTPDRSFYRREREARRTDVDASVGGGAMPFHG
jgi:hypothetical protein